MYHNLSEMILHQQQVQVVFPTPSVPDPIQNLTSKIRNYMGLDSSLFHHLGK